VIWLRHVWRVIEAHAALIFTIGAVVMVLVALLFGVWWR
jgi:hypothetical protein